MHGLSNSAKRARYYGSTVNQNQGGGPSKAGLYPTAILTSATRVAYRNRGLPALMSTMRFTRFPKTNNARNIGPNNNYGSKGMRERFTW
jgi:hypothetical protein